jgi:hypothetical protein
MEQSPETKGIRQYQEDEDGEVVRAPEEGHALVVEIHSFLLLRPEKSNWIIYKLRSSAEDCTLLRK